MSLEVSDLEAGTMYRIVHGGQEYDEMYMGGGVFANMESAEEAEILSPSPADPEDQVPYRHPDF